MSGTVASYAAGLDFSWCPLGVGRYLRGEIWPLPWVSSRRLIGKPRLWLGDFRPWLRGNDGLTHAFPPIRLLRYRVAVGGHKTTRSLRRAG